jgi:vacuolar-type H+-ATPase subunit H
VTRVAEIDVQNAELDHDDRSWAFDTGGVMLLAETVSSREDLLKAIKTAEMDGAQREEKARAKATSIRASTQIDCAKIIEKAETDGRTAMRQTMETAKAECQATKDTLVKEAVKKGQDQELISKARIPAIADMMFVKFKKEYDVKD